MSDATRPSDATPVEAVDHAREARLLGLAIGLAGGPAGGLFQSWSGNADGRWHVWLLFAACGALVGAASLPVFLPRVERLRAGLARGLGLGFLTLFGACVALVAGTFAAYPVGAAMGMVAGAVGGLAAGLVWRSAALAARGPAWRTTTTALAATAVALLVAVAWTA